MKRIYAKTTKLLIGALITTFFLSNVHGQTVYKTVANGNWNNAGIWTPSYPGNTIASTDTVYVNHDVNLNVTIDALHGTMHIAAGGSLTNTLAKNIRVLSGTLNNWGDIDIRNILDLSGTLNNYNTLNVRDEIEIIAGGVFNNHIGGTTTTYDLTMRGGILTNDGVLTVSWFLDLVDCSHFINNDFVYAANDFRVQHACAHVTNNSRINVEDDFYNEGILDGTDGIINICDTDGGEQNNKFENRSTGNVYGNQYICFCETNADNVILLDGYEDPDVSVNLTCGGPLPVEYSYVDVQADNIRRIVKILWETANEVNNEFFTVEKSLNGVHFEAIGTVNGSGNSTSFNNYSFVDDHPLQGVAYYRIKQTDLNGEFSYSKVVSAELISASNMVSIYPNPVKGSSLNVNMATETNKQVDYTITNVTGQRVQTGSIASSPYAKIDLVDLDPGMYFIAFKLNNQMSTLSVVIN